MSFFPREIYKGRVIAVHVGSPAELALVRVDGKSFGDGFMSVREAIRKAKAHIDAQEARR